MRAPLSLCAWLLCCPSVAVAQNPSFVVQQEGVIGAQLPELPDGAGAPAVAVDPANDRLFLFFESRVEAEGCPEAWAIGMATSTDGRNWTLAGTQVAPAPGTRHACGGRRPAAHIDDNGIRYLYFDALGRDGSMIAVTRSDGRRRSTSLLPDLVGLRSPSVARLDDEWRLIAVRDDGLGSSLASASSSDGLRWTVSPEVIPATDFPWDEDGVSSPSLSCADSASWPWEMFYGGWSGTESAWAWATSQDAERWYVSLPIDTWTADPWLSWDVLRMGSERVAFYEDLDPKGRPRIGIAATVEEWSVRQLEPRRCYSGLLALAERRVAR